MSGRFLQKTPQVARALYSTLGELGSGVGHNIQFSDRTFQMALRTLTLPAGGGGGSIREAGGAFGKLEAAREEEYFYNLQKTQLRALQDQLREEIEQHQQMMRDHAALIARHQKRIMEMDMNAAAQ